MESAVSIATKRRLLEWLVVAATVIGGSIAAWAIVGLMQPEHPRHKEFMDHSLKQAAVVLADLDRVVSVEIWGCKAGGWEAGGLYSPPPISVDDTRYVLKGALTKDGDPERFSALVEQLRRMLTDKKRFTPTPVGGWGGFGIRLCLGDGYYYDCEYRPSDSHDSLLIGTKRPRPVPAREKPGTGKVKPVSGHVTSISLGLRTTPQFRRMILDSLSPEAWKHIKRK